MNCLHPRLTRGMTAQTALIRSFMTYEAQVKIAEKEYYELRQAHEKQGTADSRERLNAKRDEISKLSQKMPRWDLFKSLPDYQTKRAAMPSTCVVDLDSVEWISVECFGHSIKGEDTIEKVKAFVKTHADFVTRVGYEGSEIYFFSSKPKTIGFESTDCLHNGAIGHVKNCPKNALICMDWG